MPRTIYQQNERQYIGHDIFQGTNHEDMLPVFDQELDVRYRLNAEVDQVDYEITHLDHKSATLEWRNHYDFQTIVILLNTQNRPEQAFRVNPALGRYTIKNLLDNREYEVNVFAQVPWGTTLPNRQTFRTPVNPVPDPVTGFKYTKRTNSSITLAWNPSNNSVRYHVYRAVGNGSLRQVKAVTGTTATISLSEDTKYRFAVRGVNADGLHGPQSSVIKSATGHNESRRSGSVRRLVLPPKGANSWRRDRLWDTRPPFTRSLYQGYWTRGGIGRWWGVLEYDQSRLQNIINNRFGSGVAAHLQVNEASIRRVYRQRTPGNYCPQWLEWHLTGSSVGYQSGAWSSSRTGGQPSIYGRHVNNRNSADSLSAHFSLKAGNYINFLRIPRSWGKAVIIGKSGNTRVRGLALYRGDNEWNGYGYGGYMKISGHMQRDYYLRDSWRYSDLSLVISANWNFAVRSYKGPYSW